MDAFSKDLDHVKETIELNQNSLLEGIKDKLLFSSTYSPSHRRSPIKFDELNDENTPKAPGVYSLLCVFIYKLYISRDVFFSHYY